MQGCDIEDNLELLTDFAMVSKKIVQSLRNNDEYYKMYVSSVYETILEGNLTERDLKILNEICDTALTIDFRYGGEYNVTDSAKNIFGNIVKAAYFEDKDIKYITMENNVSATIGEIKILDNKFLVIEFNNGKKVTISSSECGSIIKSS